MNQWSMSASSTFLRAPRPSPPRRAWRRGRSRWTAGRGGPGILRFRLTRPKMSREFNDIFRFLSKFVSEKNGNFSDLRQLSGVSRNSDKLLWKYRRKIPILAISIILQKLQIRKFHIIFQDKETFCNVWIQHFVCKNKSIITASHVDCFRLLNKFVRARTDQRFRNPSWQALRHSFLHGADREVVPPLTQASSQRCTLGVLRVNYTSTFSIRHCWKASARGRLCGREGKIAENKQEER